MIQANNIQLGPFFHSMFIFGFNMFSAYKHASFNPVNFQMKLVPYAFPHTRIKLKRDMKDSSVSGIKLLQNADIQLSYNHKKITKIVYFCFCN